MNTTDEALTIRCTTPVAGWSEPGGDAITLDTGTVGVVLQHVPDWDVYLVEVPNSAGATIAFAEVPVLAAQPVKGSLSGV